ncbi:MAG: Lon protease family protein [Chloroflexota bacterium]
MSVREKHELPATALRWRCEPNLFAFASTAEVDRLQEFVGQDRALRALEFGLAIDRPGYNIFATGLAGTGRASVIQAHLQRLVASKAVNNGWPIYDWCYVHNAEAPDQPRCLKLPRGRGAPLRAHMDALVRALQDEIARAFAQEAYAAARQQTVAATQTQLQGLWREAEGLARQAGFLLQVTPAEVGLVPLLDGKPADQAAVLALSAEERSALESRHTEIMETVAEAMRHANQLQSEGQAGLAALDKRVSEMAVAGPLDQVAGHYRDLPEVLDYLERVRAYTLDNLDLFVKREAESTQSGVLQLAVPGGEDAYRAYRVNVFVDNSTSNGPPIVIETNPTFANLFGRIERRAVMGGVVTDHTMIKAGALAQANGGYLVAEAREVFAHPAVWPALKRAIREQVLRLEDGGEAMGLMAPPLVKPQPIDLAVKVILLGDDGLYRLARAGDPDFWETFKVKAEFDAEIARTSDTVQAYAGFIAKCCELDALLPFDRTGVAATVEHAARMVADQNLLSTRFGLLRDLLVEADHFAGLDGQQAVSARHVRQAIEARVLRTNLVQAQIQEALTKGVLLIDVDGAVVGQVNGLAVYDLGDLAFGQPTRITARVYAGRSGVVNIEREAQLSGRSHDKGVLIITGYLGSRFAQKQPLSLSASLCFEQSYDGVDGDSASSTELYALLSSLAELPIDQSLAVTGSVNQKGEIQAIGGVNEKVEGFYDVCLAKGLTGRQGVIIPRANAQHLMLRPDVVEAVAAGRFHVYAVDSVAEGLELLTGVPLGEPDADGGYPEDTAGHKVATRLAALAEAVRRFEGRGEDTASHC